MYVVSNEFLKTFGLSSLDELPELPKIKEDMPEQLEIEEFVPKAQQDENIKEENGEGENE